jgi:hypothetical protein
MSQAGVDFNGEDLWGAQLNSCGVGTSLVTAGRCGLRKDRGVKVEEAS